jgi:hypothetical protein
MRVLRYQTNPKSPDARVPDYAALESGVMRMHLHGVGYEIASGHPAFSTIAKAIAKGDLVALDVDSAKEAARVHGVRPDTVVAVPLGKAVAKQEPGKTTSKEG